MEYGITNPSDQTEGYAQEVVTKCQKLVKDYGISYNQALEAYKIGAMAQLNDGLWDRLYKIAETLDIISGGISDMVEAIDDAKEK